MTNQSTRGLAPEHLQALEARLALRLTARLNEASVTLPHDITERLRVGREQAVARAHQVRRVSATAAAVQVQSNGAAVLSGPPSLWLRLVSILPLAVLVAGLVVIQQHHDREQISVAAEIDAALLSDELPPAAYRDPGFSAFLQSQVGP